MVFLRSFPLLPTDLPGSSCGLSYGSWTLVYSPLFPLIILFSLPWHTLFGTRVPPKPYPAIFLHPLQQGLCCRRPPRCNTGPTS